jgi:hypothetical protein
MHCIIISKDEIINLVTEPLDRCNKTAVSNFTLLHASVETTESTSLESEIHSLNKLILVFKVNILYSRKLIAAQQTR